MWFYKLLPLVIRQSSKVLVKRPVFTTFLTIRKNLYIYYNRTNFSIVLKGIRMKTIVCKKERKPLNKINLLRIPVWPLRLDASRASDVGERKMISFIAKKIWQNHMLLTIHRCIIYQTTDGGKGTSFSFHFGKFQILVFLSTTIRSDLHQDSDQDSRPIGPRKGLIPI